MLGIIEILEEENNCSIENESYKGSSTTPRYVQEKFNKMFFQYSEAIKASQKKQLSKNKIKNESEK